jgi:hypothetical protein
MYLVAKVTVNNITDGFVFVSMFAEFCVIWQQILFDDFMACLH